MTIQNTRKWVSDRTLAKYFEVHRATVWHWAKIGKIPPPIKISGNCTRWDFAEIEAAESCAFEKRAMPSDRRIFEGHEHFDAIPLPGGKETLTSKTQAKKCPD